MSQDHPLAGRRVLVVEDEYFVACDFCDWLEAAGAVIVGPAPDAAQACALLVSQRPDAAVIDINLGDGASYEVASRLADLQIPFAFATGYEEPSLPPELRTRPRLLKPASARHLVDMVSRLS